MEVLQRVAAISVIWALPFASDGIYLMSRARQHGELSTAGIVRIVIGMLLPLWIVGGIGFYLIFLDKSAPDAGLAMSVGLAFGGTGASIVWMTSALVAYLFMKSRMRRK